MRHKLRLKLLALHSFRTSGAILREQLARAGLLEALADLVEFVFVDAPNPASGPIPDDVSPHFQGPYYEWWNAQRGPDGAWAYQHADASLAFLQDVCRLHGPFDGAVGFSQGAAAAALLAGMQRAGAALDGQPPLKLLLLFAGIRVRDPALERYYASLAAVPSLHVIGDRDPVKSMTNRLIEAFDAPLVLSHPRGHVIPSLPPADLARLRAFLEAAAVDSAL